MKNFTRLKFSIAACTMLLLGSCSKATYTFAPNTGSYHGTEKTANAVASSTETQPTANFSASATTTVAQPEAATTEQTVASTALAQAFTSKSATVNTSTTNEKAGKSTFSQLRKINQLKKQVTSQFKKKDTTGQNESAAQSINRTAIVLILIGLILALLGGHSILGTLGIIILVIGLVLLVLDLI